MRKPSTSVDEVEEVAASPASSVLSAEQGPVPSKPAAASSRSARGMWSHYGGSHISSTNSELVDLHGYVFKQNVCPS